MLLKHHLLLIACLFFSTTVLADTMPVPTNKPSETKTDPCAESKVEPEAKPEPRVYVKKVKADFNTTYKKVFNSLENNSYFVVFEPNLGRNLSHFAQRWGANYNRNKLGEIRSMVFCNGWYANEISNKDPNMLALCPLHITLMAKGEMTTILFVRPSQVAIDSPAFDVTQELEQDVIRVIEEAVY